MKSFSYRRSPSNFPVFSIYLQTLQEPYENWEMSLKFKKHRTLDTVIRFLQTLATVSRAKYSVTF